MDKTTWTLSEIFEGFSQILKEQSGKKGLLDAFTHPIAIIVIDYADTQCLNFAIE